MAMLENDILKNNFPLSAFQLMPEYHLINHEAKNHHFAGFTRLHSNSQRQ